MPFSREGEGWNSRCYKAAGVKWGLQSAGSCCHALGRQECSLPGKQLCCDFSWSREKHCCCSWAAPSSSPYSMGSKLWGRTILRACPASKHFILTSTTSSGRTESWKHNLGLCHLKFGPCRGLAEAALVPVVPLCQPCHEGIAGIAG